MAQPCNGGGQQQGEEQGRDPRHFKDNIPSLVSIYAAEQCRKGLFYCLSFHLTTCKTQQNHGQDGQRRLHLKGLLRSDHWALLFSRAHCGMSPPRPSTAAWCRGKSPNFLCSRNSLVAVITMNSRFSVSRSVTGNPWPVVGCSCGPCALIGRLARHWAVIGGDGPQH